jgi:hypothetical protein
MNLLTGLGVMSVILLIVIGLAAVTEAQRSRWQRVFGWVWDSVAMRVS